MTKTQLLILLLIIALVFYYFNEENKPKPSVQEPWTIIKKPKTPQPSKTTWGNPPHSQLDELPDPPQKPQPPEPTIEFPGSREEIEFPTDLPISSNTLNCPGPEAFLTNDNSLHKNYRQNFLTLLTNLPLNPLTQKAFKTLQNPNKPLYEYFQVLWDLKGLTSFEEQLAQPLREWINLTTALKPSDTPTDYGWLTDDNLEFILSNHQPIQSALTKTNLFTLRTDLANIYNSFQRAQANQEWDLLEFAQRLTLNKTPYILFPLRVNGNHWGLFILHNLTWQESTPTYQVYYTSSGGISLETEKQQLQPFINQICGETTIQTIPPADRESQGYECGVYLVFYLQEILETGKLALNRTYSSNHCQQFRFEWKERIGARKWCQF